MNQGPQQFDESVFVSTFNQSYKEGLSYLKAHAANLLDPILLGPLFNRLRHQLDYVQLGLCVTHKENQALLKTYIGEMDFRGISFSAALRKFLTDFKFEGEGQIVDRMMQNFGDKYYEDNQGKPNFAFNSNDACVILSFSTVMLNTDLHNKQNKNKMTLEQFIKNNRGMNTQGKTEHDFDRAFLTSIYNDIKYNEIRINQEQKADTGCTQYDKWCAGEGGYVPGYLISYYILGYKPKNEPKLEQKTATVTISTKLN